MIIKHVSEDTLKMITEYSVTDFNVTDFNVFSETCLVCYTVCVVVQIFIAVL